MGSKHHNKEVFSREEMTKEVEALVQVLRESVDQGAEAPFNFTLTEGCLFELIRKVTLPKEQEVDRAVMIAGITPSGRRRRVYLLDPPVVELLARTSLGKLLNKPVTGHGGGFVFAHQMACLPEPTDGKRRVLVALVRPTNVTNLVSELTRDFLS